MTFSRQPYDPRKAEAAELARPVRQPAKKTFPWGLAIRILAFAVALGAFVLAEVRYSGDPVEEGIPLLLPNVTIIALGVALATAVIPAIWDTTYRKIGSKIILTILFVGACALFTFIGAALIVQLVGLVNIALGSVLGWSVKNQ